MSVGNADLVNAADRGRLAQQVASTLGLHYPPERWPDLERGLRDLDGARGLGGVAAGVQWLLADPDGRRARELAAHLTVAETYFYRDGAVFDALATEQLPALIERRRRGPQRRLRLWSAGCCTGEEPYTLATLLCSLLPDLEEWQVTILATDLNEGYLRRAMAAEYGDWSFRAAPVGFRDRWFEKTGAGRYRLADRIRRMVRFEVLNLVEDRYPSAETATMAMDLIFCRNVLMYFTADQAARVIARFHRALAPGGHLVVSPSEASPDGYPQFRLRAVGGALFYRPADAAEPAQREAFAWPASPPSPALPPAAVASPPPPPAPPVVAPGRRERLSAAAALARAEAAYAEGRYADVAEILGAGLPEGRPSAKAFALLARAAANAGRLGDARRWCDRWTAADRLDAAGYYLRAVVLCEMGSPAEAQAELRRAVYLAPEFIPAHFALGNLARAHGRDAEARRHFQNVHRLLEAIEPDAVLPESDGLTAGRLRQTVALLLPENPAP